MTFKPAHCPNCSANVEVSLATNHAICPYCGGTIVMDKTLPAPRPTYRSSDYVEGPMQALKAFELREKWTREGLFSFSTDLGSYSLESSVKGGMSSPAIAPDGTVLVVDASGNLWAFTGS